MKGLVRTIAMVGCEGFWKEYCYIFLKLFLKTSFNGPLTKFVKCTLKEFSKISLERCEITR